MMSLSTLGLVLLMVIGVVPRPGQSLAPKPDIASIECAVTAAGDVAFCATPALEGQRSNLLVARR